MDFSSAISSAFKRAGDFRGRSSRSEYWHFFLLSAMIQISALAVDLAVGYSIFTIAASIWALVAFVPALSLFIRRLRDGGYSPWMTLFVLAGPLGAIVFLVLLTQPSASGAPKFHDDAISSVVPDTGRPSRFVGDIEADDVSPAPSKNRLLLGVSLLITLVILVVSAVSVSMQASVADAKAEASASRASVAAVSRAKAAAAASASASASVRAEADRQAKALQARRDAEASKLAAASQAAAATARASAAARDELVSEGWAEGPDGVFYKWVPIEELKCSAYQRCTQLKVTAPDGCPNGVSVDASELTQGTVTGSSSGYSPGFVAGQNALVTLNTNDDKVDGVTIKKMTCR